MHVLPRGPAETWAEHHLEQVAHLFSDLTIRSHIPKGQLMKLHFSLLPEGGSVVPAKVLNSDFLPSQLGPISVYDKSI